MFLLTASSTASALVVQGIADIGYPQPGWRDATDRSLVIWTGGINPMRSYEIVLELPESGRSNLIKSVPCHDPD